jgi:diguanylate cyclase (GGDEF)-like protein
MSRLTRKIQFAFGSAILTLLIVGAISYRVMIASGESERWLRHTHEVLESLQDLRSAMGGIESSYRGFALTGRQTFVDSFRATRLNAQQEWSTLGALTLDNRLQQNRLPDLSRLMAAKFQFAEMVISLRRAGGVEAAIKAVQTEASQPNGDELQMLIANMENEERRLMAQRIAHAKEQLKETRDLLIVGTVLGVLIAFVGGWSTQRDQSARAVAVSVARAMALEMTHSAEHDVLTGLPNRMLFKDRVTQAITLAPRHLKKVAVLFLDLDGFKHINDSLGHPTGDKLLQSIAKRLVDCVRASDTVSRQGGDEFVVLLSEVEQPENTAITARRMLQTVAAAHSVDQHDLHISTSIGVSVYPDDGVDAETLIKNADTAMYQAKANGRQSYQFFKPSMNARAVERQSIEEGLRRALERQEFTLHYQPKVNLRTGQITGAEALLRWTNPIQGSVSPAQFIPVAEDCGLILPIREWVLREACQQAQAWLVAGLPLGTMAVNISAMEFRNENFLPGVFRVLEDTDLDPRRLEMELTESVLMKHPESTESILKTLRAKGVQVAIDDFGTGYSSLSYLRKFSIDALKIDQSFVRQITTAPDQTSLVAAIISMARSLKLRVVAEGVETQQELEFLQVHECDEAQGYYFGRPVLPQRFAGLLDNQSHLGQESFLGIPDEKCFQL